MQITRFNDEQVILISGSEGVFCIQVPGQNNPWRYTRLIDHEVSDIYLFDIKRYANSPEYVSRIEKSKKLLIGHIDISLCL